MSSTAPLLFSKDAKDSARRRKVKLPRKIRDGECVFHKDFRLLMFYRVNADAGSARIEAFKGWLGVESQSAGVPGLLFQATPGRRSHEGTVKLTCFSTLFSQELLHRLDAGNEPANMVVTKEAASPSVAPLYPAAEEGTGGMNWFAGGDGREADLLITLDSDVYEDLVEESVRLRNSIAALNRRHASDPVLMEELNSGDGGDPTSGGRSDEELHDCPA